MNIFIRLAGIIFVALGCVLAFFTSTAPLVSQVSTVFYFLAILLTASGLVAVVSKFK